MWGKVGHPEFIDISMVSCSGFFVTKVLRLCEGTAQSDPLTWAQMFQEHYRGGEGT